MRTATPIQGCGSFTDYETGGREVANGCLRLAGMDCHLPVYQERDEGNGVPHRDLRLWKRALRFLPRAMRRSHVPSACAYERFSSHHAQRGPRSNLPVRTETAGRALLPCRGAMLS